MKEITINGKVYLLIEKNNQDKNKSNDHNTGSWNTGSWNTGNCNAGSGNTGSWNTGNCNTGSGNTGDCNTGNKNTGNWNTGYWNIGDWNKTDYSAGYFNTIKQDIFIFNKKTTVLRAALSFPNFCRIKLTKFINTEDMTETEKAENPTYETTDGYLKVYDYKEAFRNSWDNASLEDRHKILLVPNFDNEIFKEITGIDVNKELHLID
jgi:hypothetical protein